MPGLPSNRLLSLDFLRGLIMVLLALEAAGLYHHLLELTGGYAVHSFFIQFTHHPWHGLRFWDLVQPGFMFMAGVAMAYSLDRQNREGKPWSGQFYKALRRSGWLFFWGVLDYAVRPQGLSFELWDVLTQLSFTCLVTFLIFRWSAINQILFSAGLLVLTELLYRFTGVSGFDQPFTDQHNFGNYVDLLLMNKINPDGWVAINALPTACHTIWGALAGKLLLSQGEGKAKIRLLFISGICCLVAGYALDWISVTPIIKRIATSSFTLATGGWCLLALAACYGWIDLMNHRRGLTFFTVIGMNSLFIYLFFEIVGHRWFNGYVSAVTNGLMAIVGLPESAILILTSLIIFGLEWGMCYYLYRKKIFFRV
jgi:predicted acyltransferase